MALSVDPVDTSIPGTQARAERADLHALRCLYEQVGSAAYGVAAALAPDWAAAERVVVEAFVVEALVAFGDDEVELVHPAAATHIRSAAHIAINAACFFIKGIPGRIRVDC